MKLIVGLGNPGKGYKNTRHNCGFMQIDFYAQKNNIEFNKKNYNGIFGELVFEGEKIIFLKPQKFINLSGEVIKDFVNYYKISLNDILIISDDLSLPPGSFKLKRKGSSGGHNGLKNIEKELKSDHYKRFKIGIGRNDNMLVSDFVLGNLRKEAKEKIEEVFLIGNSIIDDFLKYDFDYLMNKYNKKKR